MIMKQYTKINETINFDYWLKQVKSHIDFSRKLNFHLVAKLRNLYFHDWSAIGAAKQMKLFRENMEKVEDLE